MKIDPPLYPYSSEPASAWSLMQTLVLVLVLVLALPATTLVDMEIEKYQQILLSTSAMMMDASKLMLAMAPLLLHYQLIEKTAQEEEEDRIVGMESIQNAKNFEYIEATT
jgi:membrane protein YdbS with pleckstrin-like domain